METSRVIKLSRDDEDSACVLVHVTQTGSEPLDVRLEASEGDAPYFATLKHGRVASLRVKNSPVSEIEWEAILRSIFSREPLPDIQATASIQGGASMSITVRKQIQGITQRLGSISLQCDPSEGLDIFQWCISSQNALEKSDEALAQSLAQAKELEVAVKELRSQLDDLIATKQDDETALLQKFQHLLNEKKVKIREQQKIIAASASQSGQHASQQHRSEASASPPPPSRKANESRPAKRKAPARALEEEEEEEEQSSEDEADKIKSEPMDSASDTPGETDATASGGGEDEDDDKESENEDQPARQAAARPKAGSTAAQGASTTTTKKTVEAPPAPRNLPFGRKKASEQKSAPKPAESDAETEDDEL